MSIPNSRGEPPPPPLPPPTHMANITAGSDPGHFWGNKFGGGSFGNRGGSIGSESSLPRGWNQKREDDEGPDRLEYSRRGSSQSIRKAQNGLDTKHDFSRRMDEGYYSLSGPSPANYQLVHKVFYVHHLSFYATTPDDQRWFSGGDFVFPQRLHGHWNLNTFYMREIWISGSRLILRSIQVARYHKFGTTKS